jgi:hypothetical protein
MRVEFQLTVEEYLEANFPPRAVRKAARALSARCCSASATAAAAKIIIFFSGMALITLASVYLAIFVSLFWLVGLIFPGLFAYFLLAELLSDRALRRTRAQFEQDPNAARPRAVEVDDAGFHVVAEHERADIRWPGILGLLRTSNLILVVDGEPVIHIIPQRAFASDEHRVAFCRFVESHCAGLEASPAQAHAR